MFGEKAITEITQANNFEGFEELISDAKKRGNISNSALLELEKETGKKVVSKENYLKLEK